MARTCLRTVASAAETTAQAAPRPPASGSHLHQARHTVSDLEHIAGRRTHVPRPPHSTSGTSVTGSTPLELPGQRTGPPEHGAVLHFLSSTLVPSQVVPPAVGAGLLHQRRRVRRPGKEPATPGVHVALQALHSLHSPHPPFVAVSVSAHVLSAHTSSSSVGPSHRAPLGPGGGAVQARVRVRVPGPQAREHGLHTLHWLHPPAIVPVPPTPLVLMPQLGPVQPAAHRHSPPGWQVPRPSRSPQSAAAHASSPSTMNVSAFSSAATSSTAARAASTSRDAVACFTRLLDTKAAWSVREPLKLAGPRVTVTSAPLGPTSALDSVCNTSRTCHNSANGQISFAQLRNARQSLPGVPERRQRKSGFDHGIRGLRRTGW